MNFLGRFACFSRSKVKIPKKCRKSGIFLNLFYPILSKKYVKFPKNCFPPLYITKSNNIANLELIILLITCIAFLSNANSMHYFKNYKKKTSSSS